jgi:hypothetical protein
MQNDIAQAFRNLIEEARAVSADAALTVEQILRAGIEQPLPPDEAEALITRVIDVMRTRAAARGDLSTVAVLDGGVEMFIAKAMASRKNLHSSANGAGKNGAVTVALQPFNGISPRPVKPTPIFHEREVPVREGFVRTKDIKLWDENERIDIHLNQFQQKYGRRPTSEELLDIMLGKMKLPGVTEEDQFAIQNLARSIAVNGVRKPPIIDVDGKLLDGNRRLTACNYILNSTDFTTEEKKRAEWLQVWQLSEYATDADREAVIVSLNFEPDNKQDWPEYVKARKVYDYWQAALTMEPRAERNAGRQREIKREIARRFALAMNEVNRYIQMVDLANEFEDYHVADRKQDKYAVKHRAERYFQYFDELGKGKNEGGVFWSLNQDDSFKHLIFDLLYDDKFQSWKQIRDLKYVYSNEDALEILRKARAENDVEEAQEKVDDACGFARTARAATRQVGANTRIKIFVDWFVDLPVKVFRDGEPGAVTRGNLIALHTALKLVEGHLAAGAGAAEAGKGD